MLFQVNFLGCDSLIGRTRCRLVGIGLLPLFEVWRRTSTFLPFLDRSFPRLIRLFRALRICRLAGIVFGGVFAHSMLLIYANTMSSGRFHAAG